MFVSWRAGRELHRRCDEYLLGCTIVHDELRLAMMLVRELVLCEMFRVGGTAVSFVYRVRGCTKGAPKRFRVGVTLFEMRSFLSPSLLRQLFLSGSPHSVSTSSLWTFRSFVNTAPKTPWRLKCTPSLHSRIWASCVTLPSHIQENVIFSRPFFSCQPGGSAAPAYARGPIVRLNILFTSSFRT